MVHIPVFVIVMCAMYKLSRPFDGLQLALTIFMSVAVSLFCVDIVAPFICLIGKYIL